MMHMILVHFDVYYTLHIIYTHEFVQVDFGSMHYSQNKVEETRVYDAWKAEPIFRPVPHAW